MESIEKLYTAHGINEVREYLKQYSNDKVPLAYRILIDHWEVIPLTYDLSDFDYYLNYLRENSKHLTIQVYRKITLERTYIFSLNGVLSQKAENETTVRVDKEAYENQQRENIRLFEENLSLQSELSASKTGQNKTDQQIEKVEKTKVIDIGDFILYISPKSEILQLIQTLNDSAIQQVTMFEKVKNLIAPESKTDSHE